MVFGRMWVLVFEIVSPPPTSRDVACPPHIPKHHTPARGPNARTAFVRGVRAPPAGKALAVLLRPHVPVLPRDTEPRCSGELAKAGLSPRASGVLDLEMEEDIDIK